MVPFPENSSIFSCVLYTCNVWTCCTSSSRNEAFVHNGWHRLYVYIYFLLYLLCDSAPSHGVQINLTVSLRTHSAQSAASSSGNAEQFPHSDICYLLILVHAVFLYIRRVAMQHSVCSQCSIVLEYERDVLRHTDLEKFPSVPLGLFSNLTLYQTQLNKKTLPVCRNVKAKAGLSGGN